MIYEPIWGAIIAWYLFLAGLGGGAFATAVFVRYRHPDCKRLMRVGRLIAPIVVIIGLCLLMFDAAAGFAHPLRFALLLTNFGSVMTWGVVFLAVFVVVALIVLVLDLMKREVPMWLDCVGLVMGLRRHLHRLPARRVPGIPPVEQRASADSVPRVRRVHWHGRGAARRRVLRA